MFVAAGQQRHRALVPDLHVGRCLPEEQSAPTVGGDQGQDVHCPESLVFSMFIVNLLFVFNLVRIRWPNKKEIIVLGRLKMTNNAKFFCDYCKSSNISYDFTGLRGHLSRYHKIEAKLSFLFSIILVQHDEDEKLTSLLQSLVDQTKIILSNLNAVDHEIEIIEEKKHETSRKALEKKLLEVLDSDSEDEIEHIDVVEQDQEERKGDNEEEIQEVTSDNNLNPGEDVINVQSEEELLHENQNDHFVSIEETVEHFNTVNEEEEGIEIIEKAIEEPIHPEIESANKNNHEMDIDAINTNSDELLLQENHDGHILSHEKTIEEADIVKTVEDTEHLSDSSVSTHEGILEDSVDNSEESRDIEVGGWNQADDHGKVISEDSAESGIVKQEELRHEVNLVHRFLNLDLCRLCYETVPTESKEDHEKEFHGKDKHELEMEFFTLKDLTHSCEICVSKFLSANLLDAHKQKVHKLKRKETEEFKCDLCFTAFKKNDVYKKHIDMNHKLERKMLQDGELHPGCLSFSCQDCDLTFLTDSLVDCHKMNTHFAKKTKMPCNMCGKSMLKKSIRRHKEIFHQEDTGEKRNESPLIGNKNADDNTNMSPGSREISGEISSAAGKDTSSLHQKDRGCIKCNLCYQPFAKNSDMKRHFYRHHHDMAMREFLHTEVPSEKLISPCSLCDLRFLNDDLLDEHVKKHYLSDVEGSQKSNAEYRTICKLCLLDYKTVSNLINHKNSVHSSELEAFEKNIKKKDLIYKCVQGQCPKRYFTKISLDFHISRIHNLTSGKRPRDADDHVSGGRIEFKNPRHSIQGLNKDDHYQTQSKCLLCGKTLGSEKDLFDHCLEEHSLLHSDKSDNISGLSTNQTIDNFFSFLDSFSVNS